MRMAGQQFNAFELPRIKMQLTRNSQQIPHNPL
jgi:hypothetical protein